MNHNPHLEEWLRRRTTRLDWAIAGTATLVFAAYLLALWSEGYFRRERMVTLLFSLIIAVDVALYAVAMLHGALRGRWWRQRPLLQTEVYLAGNSPDWLRGQLLARLAPRYLPLLVLLFLSELVLILSEGADAAPLLLMGVFLIPPFHGLSLLAGLRGGYQIAQDGDRPHRMVFGVIVLLAAPVVVFILALLGTWIGFALMGCLAGSLPGGYDSEIAFVVILGTVPFLVGIGGKILLLITVARRPDFARPFFEQIDAETPLAYDEAWAISWRELFR